MATIASAPAPRSASRRERYLRPVSRLFGGGHLADFDYERTMRAVFDAVNEADDARDGIARLIKFCRAEAPADAALWDDLARRDFAADYAQFRDDFGDNLKGSPIPEKYN